MTPRLDIARFVLSTLALVSFTEDGDCTVGIIVGEGVSVMSPDQTLGAMRRLVARCIPGRDLRPGRIIGSLGACIDLAMEIAILLSH